MCGGLHNRGANVPSVLTNRSKFVKTVRILLFSHPKTNWKSASQDDFNFKLILTSEVSFSTVFYVDVKLNVVK